MADEPHRGRVTPGPKLDAEASEYFDRSEAGYGRPSTRDQRHGAGQEFNTQDNPHAGRADAYERSAEHEQEYNPGVNQDVDRPDIIGHSESSEGHMANQNPFNVASEAITSKKAQQQQERALQNEEPEALEMSVGKKQSNAPGSNHPSRNNQP